jgi:heme exporter protein CcmD
MSFESWGDFVAMGGYAAYVFGAYGLTVAVGVGLVAQVWVRKRRWEQGLRAQLRAQEKQP